jgi:hypothetical protein
MATHRVTERIANWLTFLLWLGLIVSAALAVVDGQERTPLATEMQRALAPLAISEDGHTVIFRGTAIAAMKIRVEPEAGTFGQTIEFTVGDVRTGRWGLK